MHEMEKEYGSLFKAMIQKSKKAKADGKKSGGPAGPGGTLTSIKGGLYGIIERFLDLYSDFIELERPVLSIIREDELYNIRFKNGCDIKANSVIIATPSYVASEITKELSEGLSYPRSKLFLQ